MFAFGKSSSEKLATCNKNLQAVMQLAIKRTTVDFGISEGYRSEERQQELYKQGRTEPGEIVTHVDGINKKSKHNEKPSKAVDIFGYVNGKATYDVPHMCLIAGVILACADELKIPIRWGGNFDQDGQIMEDWNDLPHFELR